MEALSLEQAYFIGELIAAFAVVLSLLTVAWQMHQNTLATQSQALSSAIQIGQTELVKFGEPGFADVFTKSIMAPDQLTIDEVHQLNAWNIFFLIGRNNDFQLYKIGVLSEERWKINEPAVSFSFSSKWHRSWLKTGGRHFFEDDFIEWAEGVVDNSPFDTGQYYQNFVTQG